MTFSLIALALYGVTLLCMLWVARADPGQVSMSLDGFLEAVVDLY